MIILCVYVRPHDTTISGLKLKKKQLLLVVKGVHYNRRDKEDKNVLMNGGWLNDKVIYAGMQLLKAAFPHLSRFQNPILQVTNCFDIQRSTEFIQCLNVVGMHRITIATVGCTHGNVRVYDSLNKKLSKSVKNTVADLCKEN